eukprot:630352-Pyramimonas_sp.AAC.1
MLYRRGSRMASAVDDNGNWTHHRLSLRVNGPTAWTHSVIGPPPDVDSEGQRTPAVDSQSQRTAPRQSTDSLQTLTPRVNGQPPDVDSQSQWIPTLTPRVNGQPPDVDPQSQRTPHVDSQSQRTASRR